MTGCRFVTLLLRMNEKNVLSLFLQESKINQKQRRLGEAARVLFEQGKFDRWEFELLNRELQRL